jgi:hypothetical protein
MMGFGGMGMAIPWLFGAMTLAAIWAGVFWIVASLGGAHAHAGPSTQSAAELTPPTWQQPTFTAGDASATEPDPTHDSVRPEGAPR